MTNNERFNEMLNACQNPQAVAAALLELVGNGKDRDLYIFLLHRHPETYGQLRRILEQPEIPGLM